jgi:PKD repeat protein
MKNFIRILLFLSVVNLQGQNENKKWFFGNKAGLDFMTSPPTIVTTGSMTTSEGCASISDAAGNLLFYTNGVDIWDKTHAFMANGNNLLGDVSSSQGSIVVKQPGSSILYYVFTLGGFGSGALNYSIVDMSLAAGLGSVTVKNFSLVANLSEKMTSVKHCNGTDFWIVVHDNFPNNFRAYLLTASGVSSSAVVSNIGPVYNGPCWAGNMKISPNSRKLAVAKEGGFGGFELFDFDNATGIISNYINLGDFSTAYGMEFSPDGTKLYGTREFYFSGFYQWDLCAGSASAIASSVYSASASGQLMGMQLGTDGKIYVAKHSQTSLSVIQNPNASGAACNFVYNGQSIAPKVCFYNLPNFITSSFKFTSIPFTYTLSCNSVSFSVPSNTNAAYTNCSAFGYSMTSQSWNFGDPGSGSANISTMANPVHKFSATGTYTVKCITYNNCSPDTLTQVITILKMGPTIGITGKTIICSGQSAMLTATGAATYSWKPVVGQIITTSTAALSPTVSSTYTLTGLDTISGCSAVKVITVSVSQCLGNDEEISSPELFIYPNPTDGVFTLENSVNEKISLTDQFGSVLFERTYEAGQHTIDLKDLSDGVYILRSVSATSSVTRRLIKKE